MPQFRNNQILLGNHCQRVKVDLAHDWINCCLTEERKFKKKKKNFLPQQLQVWEIKIDGYGEHMDAKSEALMCEVSFTARIFLGHQ